MAGGKTYNHNIKIKTDVDVKGVDKLGTSLEKVVKFADTANSKLKNLDLDIKIDAGKSIQELNNLAGQIGNIEKSVKGIKNPKIQLFDSASSKAVIGITSNVGNLQKQLKSIDGKSLKGVASEANALTNALEGAASAAGNLGDAIRSVSGINLSGAVSQANNLAKAYDNAARSANNTAKNSKNINGSQSSGGGGSSGQGIGANMLLGAVAGKTAYDLTMDNAATKETNRATMSTWKNYDSKVFDQIDKATDKATVTMNATVPSMNAFAAATGVDAKFLGDHAETFTNFGTKVQALGYSEAEANQAMMDLAKGANGAFASLDQYGVSEESLKATGKWDGDPKKLDEFMAALDEVVGDVGVYKDTWNYQKEQLKKDFSRGGAELGKLELALAKPVLEGFTQLDELLFKGTQGLFGIGVR